MQNEVPRLIGFSADVFELAYVAPYQEILLILPFVIIVFCLIFLLLEVMFLRSYQ